MRSNDWDEWSNPLAGEPAAAQAGPGPACGAGSVPMYQPGQAAPRSPTAAPQQWQYDAALQHAPAAQQAAQPAAQHYQYQAPAPTPQMQQTEGQMQPRVQAPAASNGMGVQSAAAGCGAWGGEAATAMATMAAASAAANIFVPKVGGGAGAQGPDAAGAVVEQMARGVAQSIMPQVPSLSLSSLLLSSIVPQL